MNNDEIIDYAFGAATGYQQAGYIFAGGFLFLIGFLILLLCLYVLFKSERFEGKIHSLRVQGKADIPLSSKPTLDDFKNEMYYPVYEYLDNNGNAILAESNSGSNFLADKEPGKSVRLWIMPDMPSRADEEGYWWVLFVMFFCGIGTTFISLGLNSFKVGIFTWIFLFGFILYGISKMISRMRPVAKRSTFNEWRQKKAKEFADKRLAMQTIGYSEWKTRILLRDKQYKKSIPVLFLIALACLGLGYYLISDITKSLTEGIRTKGGVVNFQESKNAEEIIYYPIVRFSDFSNNIVEFKDRVGGSPPPYKIDDKVTVIYSANSSFRPFIDKGIWNWVMPGGLIGFGIIMLFFTIKTHQGIRKRERL